MSAEEINVSDTKWEDLALLFTSNGIRHMPIEYFPVTELSKANAWVAAASERA